MKKICKVILAAAAVVALAVPAMAADKLIVKNAGGTADVFKVDDVGSITAGILNIDNASKKSGFGLSTGHAPESSLHLVDLISTAARGLIMGQHNDGNAAANIVFRKSRGTDLAPTAVLQGDFVGAFHGSPWNGTNYITSATINYVVDGPVTSGPTGNAPQSMLLSTGSNNNGIADPGNKTERVRITSAGNVIVGNKGGNASAALATNVTDGFIYVPTVAGALTSCSTVTVVNGHTPIWFDSTNLKVCTCSAGALKCTTALN